MRPVLQHALRSLSINGETGHESRLFAPGERLIAKGCLPQADSAAFKPEILYLTGAKGWHIYDVRLNGQSQCEGGALDGALFSTAQGPTGKAIVSGFDTLPSGGSFEIEASFQGDGRVEKAPFVATVVGFSVAPDQALTAYSGPIRLRDIDGRLIATAWEGPARVQMGESAWFVVRPLEQSFKPQRLAIALDCECWDLEDLRVNGRAQFAVKEPIPGKHFRPGAMDAYVALEHVSPTRSLAIFARYRGTNPRGGRFGAVVHGVVGA